VEAEKFMRAIKVPAKFDTMEYQLEAFVHAIREKRALLLSPTSSGKSLIIYLILRYLKDILDAKKLLVIVPNIALVNQLASDFADYGYDVDRHVHRIYGGMDKQTGKAIAISTWQSLATLPRKYFEQFEVVIGDECHQFKAKSLTEIMTCLTKTKYRIGTTGTLDGSLTNAMVLEGLFGPVRKVNTNKELMDSKRIADFEIKGLLLKYPEDICKQAKTFTYQQEIEFLIGNEARNNFIKNLALSLKGNTLILFQFVDKHGKYLYDIISKEVTAGRKVYFVYGGTDVDVREEIRGIVEKETDAIIIASYGVFSTGISIKNLHNIIFASPSKSRIRNLQSIGRGLRISDTKKSAVLFDIADDMRHKRHENYTLEHFAIRIRYYTEEQHKFKIYKIDLK